MTLDNNKRFGKQSDGDNQQVRKRKTTDPIGKRSSSSTISTSRSNNQQKHKTTTKSLKHSEGDPPIISKAIKTNDNGKETTKKTSEKKIKKISLTNHFITYMLKLYKIMVNILNLFNPTKKNRLPAIDDQILLTPAHKLSARIKEGHLSSQQVVGAYIERIKIVQPHINAVCEERFDEAIKEAKQLDERLKLIREKQQQQQQHQNNNDLNQPNNNNYIDNFDNDQDRLLWQSPLAGVPISVKESIAVKGMIHSCGLWSRMDSRALEDSIVVNNSRKLGLIPIVTTNVPELTLYWADCMNKVYGRTQNPYDLSRVPGASSGGEGSLLGSGGSLIGIGSDIGGSLRIPAHFCGVFSHKPTPYAVSAVGNYPKIKPRRLPLFSFGPMARYASDLKPLLKCIMLDHDNHITSLSKSQSQEEDAVTTTTIDQLQDGYQQENESTLMKFDNNVNNNNELLLDEAQLKLIPLDLDRPVNLSDITIYYCDHSDSEIKPSLVPQKDMIDGINDIVEHFSNTYNCRIKPLNLDKYYRYAMIQWHVMMKSSLKSDAVREIKEEFGLANMPMEWVRLLMGTSKHTKESMLAVMITRQAPDPVKAPLVCERFQKLNSELRKEFNDLLGDRSVLIVPTMPSTAFKHNEALMRTPDLRYTVLFNILLCPVTQAVFGFDKQNKMPFGYSVAAKPGLDRLTLAVAEEIENRFGGWRQPATTTVTNNNTKTIATKQQQKQQLQQPN